MTQAILAIIVLMAPVPIEKPHDPQEWGYLGVRVTQGTLQIVSIEPNTPAAKAGLMPNDEFTRVGSLTPSSFEQVAEHISSFRPGSWMRVEVRRGAETKSFIVKLGVRPSDLPPPPVKGRPMPELP